MTTTINADTVVGGAVVTGDASGQLGLQAAGVTKLTVSSSGVTLASALPVASGGTGTTSTTFANLTTNVTGTLPIANGGTNSTATATAGGIGYGTGTAHAYSVVGTSGQVLTSAGASAPTWATPSAGALVYLSQATASSSATVDIETGIGSTYNNYMLVASDVYLSTSGSQLLVQMKISGTYQTASYQWVHVNSTSGAGTVSGTGSSNDTQMQIANNLDSTDTSTNLGFTLYFGNVNSANYKTLWGNGGVVRASSNNARIYSFMGGYFGGTGTLTGIRFSPLSSTIARGTFRLYGIVNS